MIENWTSLKLIQWTTEYFEKKGIPNPRLDAELLLAHALKCQRIDLYTGHEKIVPQKHLDPFRAFVERRAKREPLQYIVGETEFWGLKIKVTPEVLIPRPETEMLVEEGLKFSDARSILDIGTGSGCIAIAVAKSLPGAKIVATDVSKEAIALARENAKFHKVSERIDFILSDIAPWRVFEAEGQRFDLIVSNPPYISTGEFPNLQPEVRDFEPRKALDGGPKGLDVILKILEEAPPFLKPTSYLLLEIGEGQAVKIPDLLPKNTSLKLRNVRKDYSGHDRIAVLAFPPAIL